MISLLANDEQRQIIGGVSDFLDANLSVDRFRKPDDRRRLEEEVAWKLMAELGWFGLGISEAEGGVGYSVVEEALVHREFGRHLLSPATISSVIGAHIALKSGRAALAEEIIAGATRVAFSVPLLPNRKAEQFKGPVHLIDAADAAYLLLLTGGRAALIQRSYVHDIVRLKPLDESITLEQGELDRAEFVVSASDGLRTELARADILMSAYMVGMAEASCDLAVEYAKIRQQFGSPIGSFQAIAHPCVDMMLRAKAAYAQVAFAAVAERDMRPDAPFQVASAAIVATEAAVRNPAVSIQVHGGIGYTAECHAHRYLKRANLMERVSGGVRLQRRKLLACPPAE